MTKFNLIADAILAINQGESEKAITYLKQFTVLNTPKVKGGGKVKIYDYTNPKGAHPAFTGVYHDSEKRVAVATDSSILMVSAPDYYSEYADKIVNKYGVEVKCTPLKWDKVFPASNALKYDHRVRKVDRKRIADLLSEIRAEQKVDKMINYLAINIGTIEDPFYVSPKYCKLLLTWLSGKFWFHKDRNHPLYYESDDGNYKGLLMPCKVNEQYLGQEKIRTE